MQDIPFLVISSESLLPAISGWLTFWMIAGATVLWKGVDSGTTGSICNVSYRGIAHRLTVKLCSEVNRNRPQCWFPKIAPGRVANGKEECKTYVLVYMFPLSAFTWHYHSCRKWSIMIAYSSLDEHFCHSMCFFHLRLFKGWVWLEYD